MVRPWLVGKRRRTIEKDYKFYDTPKMVWSKITQNVWPYKTRVNYYEVRDRALMCLLYLTACRISEIVRGIVYVGLKGEKHRVDLPSITRGQFIVEEDYIKIRNMRIVKRNVVSVDEYPKRKEIALPRKGDLTLFTKPIEDYLSLVGPDEELFKFGPSRAWQIVNCATGEKPNGEMPHYLRDMGLKLYSRILDRNIKDLQEFSGHERIENLLKYLGEGNLEKKIIDYKF